MTPVGWMVVPSIGCWVAATALFGMQTGAEIFLGMIAPLAVTVASWVSIERAHKRDPQRVTGILMAGFAGKLVFFGGYVLVVLRVFGVRPMPFVISFVAYFIALYLIEALALKRLFNS